MPFKNKIKMMIIVIFLLIISIDFTYLNYKASTTLNEECSTTFEYRNNHVGLIMPVNGTMVLRPNSTGMIELSGVVELNGSTYKLGRSITFEYERESDSIFRLKNMGLEIYAIDNLNNNFMDTNFFSIGGEYSRRMTLSIINNAFIIGNLLSPVFMCVIKP